MTTYTMANLNQWFQKTEARMEAVFKTAAQDMVQQVTETKAKGGNFPVDTGFARNSILAAINSIPSGRSKQPKGYLNADLDLQPTVLVINRAKIGDRIVVGIVAEYAIYIEARDAPVRKAAQRWPATVKNAAAKVRREVTQ
jgi:hypothetical protein